MRDPNKRALVSRTGVVTVRTSRTHVVQHHIGAVWAISLDAGIARMVILQNRSVHELHDGIGSLRSPKRTSDILHSIVNSLFRSTIHNGAFSLNVVKEMK